jgi:hypothetical protein
LECNSRNKDLPAGESLVSPNNLRQITLKGIASSVLTGGPRYASLKSGAIRYQKNNSC